MSGIFDFDGLKLDRIITKCGLFLSLWLTFSKPLQSVVFLLSLIIGNSQSLFLQIFSPLRWLHSLLPELLLSSFPLNISFYSLLFFVVLVFWENSLTCFFSSLVVHSLAISTLIFNPFMKFPIVVITCNCRFLITLSSCFKLPTSSWKIFLLFTF